MSDVEMPRAQRAPKEIFDAARIREQRLSRLLVLYVVTGLVFMLLPGTFLGVWNLLAISARETPQSVSPAWLQAHGHAQIFGWIGSFILGIGFHSIPRLRRRTAFALAPAWISWVCWTLGVSLRWAVNVYEWHWRALLPLSGALELAAFLIFFATISTHEAARGERRAALDTWILVVIGATCGFLLALLVNFGGTVYVALAGDSPAFPAAFDQRFLPLETWGFLVPFVWGFSARWLPVFMGLQPTRNRVLLAAFSVNAAAVLCALAGRTIGAVVLAVCAAILAPTALRLFERPLQPPKTRGVHPSFPSFIRAAYAWAIVGAALGAWAETLTSPTGVLGASRHALTVGFLATMVFSVGQRILPAFSGGRLLFSPRLMLAALLLLNAGCALRVSAEILAYQRYAAWAWSVLPASAVIELSAVSVFAANLALTFATRPPGPPMAR